MVTKKNFPKEIKNIVDHRSEDLKPVLRHIKAFKSYYEDPACAQWDNKKEAMNLPIGFAVQDKPSQNNNYDYFLDFGSHLGQGLEKICEAENLKDDIQIHCFEANPHIFQKIEFKDNVQYYNIAVSDINGFFDLNYETHNNGGATLISLDHWNPEKVYQWKEQERYQKYKQATVPSLSISNILDWLIPDKKEKSILAKFDIEGAEYGVFEQLRSTDNFKWFSKIYVEFHLHLLKDIRPLMHDMDWLNYFESIGLDAVIWD